VNAPAPSSPEPEIVSKSEFARLSNVVPGRVTQWISAKQIYGDALVGEGRAARIRVATARAQLKRHLDVGQRLGNGLSTRLDSPPEQPSLLSATNASPAPAEPPQVLPFVRPTDVIEEQIKAQRLEGYRRDNRRKAEEEAARSGRYILADDATRQMGRITSQMLNTFEGWQGEVSSKIAAKFSVPQRDVLHLIRSEFRTFRSHTSEALRQQVQEIAEFVEDDLPEVESPGEEV
jgi:hypothetical protein